MAETKSFVELLQLLIIFMAYILNMLVELRVLKVDIGDTWWIIIGLWIVFTILKLTCREAFELHNILC